jgi:hypothetical protein
MRSLPFFLLISFLAPAAWADDDEQKDEDKKEDDKKDDDKKSAEDKDKEEKEKKEKEKKEEDKEWKRSCANDDETTVKLHAATGCSVIGLRIAFTSMDVPNTGLNAGVMFAGQGEDYGRWSLFSVRATHKDGIGGGGAGFEGELGGTLTVGIRVPFSRKQGPIARVGVAGHILGNDLFYSSRIELPRSELGYQYMSGVVVVEAGATMGYVIDGRYGQRVPPHTDGTSPHTPIAGFELGGYLSVQVPHVRLGVSLENVPMTEGFKGNILMGQASACLVGFVFAFCGDMRTLGQDGLFGSALRSTYYGGLTFGFTSKS